MLPIPPPPPLILRPHHPRNNSSISGSMPRGTNTASNSSPFYGGRETSLQRGGTAAAGIAVQDPPPPVYTPAIASSSIPALGPNSSSLIPDDHDTEEHDNSSNSNRHSIPNPETAPVDPQTPTQPPNQTPNHQTLDPPTEAPVPYSYALACADSTSSSPWCASDLDLESQSTINNAPPPPYAQPVPDHERSAAPESWIMLLDRKRILGVRARNFVIGTVVVITAGIIVAGVVGYHQSASSSEECGHGDSEESC